MVIIQCCFAPSLFVLAAALRSLSFAYHSGSRNAADSKRQVVCYSCFSAHWSISGTCVNLQPPLGPLAGLAVIGSFSPLQFRWFYCTRDPPLTKNLHMYFVREVRFRGERDRESLKQTGTWRGKKLGLTLLSETEYSCSFFLRRRSTGRWWSGPSVHNA